MLKRIISILMSISIFAMVSVSCFATLANQDEIDNENRERICKIFPELKIKPYYFDLDPLYVAMAYDSKVMIGLSETEWAADKLVTRAEFIQYCYNAFFQYFCKIDIDVSNVVLPFSDTQSKKFYSEALKTLYCKGIVKGYPNGLFEPDRYVRAEEAGAIIGRIFKEIDFCYLHELETNMESFANCLYYSDVSEWAKDDCSIIGNYVSWTKLDFDLSHPGSFLIRYDLAKIFTHIYYVRLGDS